MSATGAGRSGNCRGTVVESKGVRKHLRQGRREGRGIVSGGAGMSGSAVIEIGEPMRRILVDRTLCSR